MEKRANCVNLTHSWRLSRVLPSEAESGDRRSFGVSFDHSIGRVNLSAEPPEGLGITHIFHQPVPYPDGKISQPGEFQFERRDSKLQILKGFCPSDQRCRVSGYVGSAFGKSINRNAVVAIHRAECGTK